MTCLVMWFCDICVILLMICVSCVFLFGVLRMFCGVRGVGRRRGGPAEASRPGGSISFVCFFVFCVFVVLLWILWMCCGWLVFFVHLLWVFFFWGGGGVVLLSSRCRIWVFHIFCFVDFKGYICVFVCVILWFSVDLLLIFVLLLWMFVFFFVFLWCFVFLFVDVLCFSVCFLWLSVAWGVGRRHGGRTGTSRPLSGPAAAAPSPWPAASGPARAARAGSPAPPRGEPAGARPPEGGHAPARPLRGRGLENGGTTVKKMWKNKKGKT